MEWLACVRIIENNVALRPMARPFRSSHPFETEAHRRVCFLLKLLPLWEDCSVLLGIQENFTRTSGSGRAFTGVSIPTYLMSCY
jgi:hypothetical protein